MNDALAQRRLADPVPGLLILLLLLLAVPHLANLGLSIFALLFSAAAWRLVAIPMPHLLPGRWLLAVLLLPGIGLVILSIDLFDGRRLGTALLIVMLGFKLLELKTRRDLYVCIYLGFFLTLTQFLFQQSLWLALYLFVLNGMLAGLMVMLNRVQTNIRGTLLTSLNLWISALPMALVLFLLFPRLESPLWAIEISTAQGLSGIGQQMKLGSIGELTQSPAIAFRARFSGKAPVAEQRYWRGLVLWHFDGDTWRQDSGLSRPGRVKVGLDSLLAYEITLEPSQQPWVFALDMPSGVPHPLLLNDDLRVIAPGPISVRTRYQLQAYTDYLADEISPRQRQLGLTLAYQARHRTRELAERWQRQYAGDTAAIVRAALRHFNREAFVYTLKPGLVAGDPVEQFLFETRRGFCEHYAGSFAVLMRLAGIPTRVVLGYQGGEYNPRAGHWVVRQSDAHAWNEVWMHEAGWVRVDPTAAVAPERIERTIDSGLSRESDRVVFRITSDSPFASLAREAGWLRDAAEMGWHRWVLGFSHDRQSSLLDSLGLKALEGYGYLLAILAAMGLGPILAYAIGRLRDRPPRDPVLVQWQKLLARMQRRGLDIPAWFGPGRVLAAAIGRWPGQDQALREIVHLYIQLRYGKVHRADQQQRLKQSIRRLKLS